MFLFPALSWVNMCLWASWPKRDHSSKASQNKDLLQCNLLSLLRELLGNFFKQTTLAKRNVKVCLTRHPDALKIMDSYDMVSFYYCDYIGSTSPVMFLAVGLFASESPEMLCKMKIPELHLWPNESDFFGNGPRNGHPVILMHTKVYSDPWKFAFSGICLFNSNRFIEHLLCVMLDSRL